MNKCPKCNIELLELDLKRKNKEKITCQGCLDWLDELRKFRSGSVYACSEPEFVGKIPVRQDIEVLSADKEQPKLSWTVQEFVGPEITFPESKDPITEESALQKGTKIWVPHILGGFIPMVVNKDEHGELYGESDCHIAVLEFGRDSRNCWSMSCLINKKVLKMAMKTNA